MAKKEVKSLPSGHPVDHVARHSLAHLVRIRHRDMDVLVPVYSRYSRHYGYLPRYRYMDVQVPVYSGTKVTLLDIDTWMYKSPCTPGTTVTSLNIDTWMYSSPYTPGTPSIAGTSLDTDTWM